MLHLTVYRGTSVNRQNGGSPGRPTFGRFAASVDVGSLIVERGESGEFLYRFPRFCTCGNYETEAEATQAARDWLAHNRDGWTTDMAAADGLAIEAARKRHNEHCGKSEGYCRQHGGPINA